MKPLLTLKPKNGHMVAVLLANPMENGNQKSLGANCRVTFSLSLP